MKLIRILYQNSIKPIDLIFVVFAGKYFANEKYFTQQKNTWPLIHFPLTTPG